jgi:peptide/nickel transport system substrate-binding protein
MALKGDPSWLVTDFVERVDFAIKLDPQEGMVLDKYAIKFVLKNPVAYFPSLVASTPYFPVNPLIYPKDKIIRSVSELKGGKLVGLGPYTAVSFKRDQEVIMEANPNYYGAQPKTKRIVIRYFADATTMRLALEKGEIDIAFKTLNPSDISDLEKSDKVNTIKAQGPYIRYLCFLCAEPPFKDKVLRQAVTAAINRPEIMQKVFLGQNAPLYSMVPMGMWSHTDEFKTVYGDGNIQKAKKLLTSKGYSESNKFVFDLWYTPSHYGDTEVDMAAVLKAQLDKTGMMTVNVKSAEWATYRDQWHNKQMPCYLLGWYPDYIDPDNYTAAFAGTAGSAGMGIYFSDPEWDKILTQGQTVPDMNKRIEIYKEIQRMWAEDIPTAPIFQGTLYVFTQKNVHGVKLSPTLRFNYDPLYKD